MGRRVVLIWMALVGLAAAAPDLPAPAGHESSSGVAITGGGFITATAVWVTPGLTEQPYYAMWVSDAQTRAIHRRAAASYTVMLLELANNSRLRIEGFLSLNVRLRILDEYYRPISDEALARTFPDLMPAQGREQIMPHQRLVRPYAFPKVPVRDQPIAFVTRPLWLFDRHTQIGQLPDFELRFNPIRLAFPP
ncbi:MAG: hypothetical protein QN141_12855 [Armatimonadota bacterium]|nr:hypothetical protein [Armatimonadota bacterium]MDR7452541.1 hypothetical protein [Armatimonadota bacterium]MDR7467768.1 hypothetical protein [Armatimonadota bacterium]MDR7494968.1 hypothetical protein [Armatimonadota bacterium]MDR7499767.1 hypothetical protein [Armatimonadota bacterium]